MQRRHNVKKKPTVYVVVLCLWAVCVAVLVASLAWTVAKIPHPLGAKGVAVVCLLATNTFALALLWLGSIKDFVFSCAYKLASKSMQKAYQQVEEQAHLPTTSPRFVLLYCTCNDFNPTALLQSSHQHYNNYKTVILDDSTDQRYVKQIDDFVDTHAQFELVRRVGRQGYKAGNLNNYLEGRTDYDYFVVLDADEIVPPNYIQKVQKYFAFDKLCGAVQARHTATDGENLFQQLLGLSVGSNGKTVQVVKNFYGANALLGHGMTVSRACYQKTGGFPHVVAEDISFAVEVKNAGMNVLYAPDVLCQEQFPNNYVALKKRQCKWTQGNLEYMAKYNKDISKCPMTWFEKLDVRISHYSLPIVPMLGLLLTACTIALGFLGYPTIAYSLGVYLLMLLFLASPLIPDLFVYRKSKKFALLLPYFVVTVCTYASLAPMMIRTVLLGFLGKKAVFLVTPKQSKKFTFAEALKYTADSLLFALATSILSLLACGSILPVILVVVGCAVAPFLVLLANVPATTLQKKKKSKRQNT